MIILGIETSCDETAVAVLEIKGSKKKLLSSIVASQIEIHEQYGGVVPEVAARNHVVTILPTIDAAFKKARITNNKIDAIAVTRGPGLITSLAVGVETARILAMLWNKPLVGVNHIEGHMYSNFLNNDAITFPALNLIVSGGHTELILMKDYLKYQLLGATRDDAAGEAFDKVAKMLDLGYPGGPAISKQASRGKDLEIFPRPMLASPDFDFSFSGLKTSVRYMLRNRKKKKLTDLCTSFEQAVVDVLVGKTIRAAKKYNVKSILLSGGVAANTRLRSDLASAVKEKLPKVQYHQPSLTFCTDNAAMIAMAGYFRARAKKFDRWDNIQPDPNWELGRARSVK